MPHAEQVPPQVKHPSIRYLAHSDLYQIYVYRGLSGQHRRKITVTPEEARIILAQLVGELKQRKDIPRPRRAA